MEVYEWEWPGGDASPMYATLGVADEKDGNLDDCLYVGKPFAGVWSPVQLQTHGSKRLKKKGLPDCNNWLSVPIFSERAVEALGDFLTANGELLPVICDEKQFYAYNVLTLIPDALDEEHSELKRFEWGPIMHIYSCEFRPDKIRGATIFKLPQYVVRVYLTDIYVKRATEADLTGFNAIRIWTDIVR